MEKATICILGAVVGAAIAAPVTGSAASLAPAPRFEATSYAELIGPVPNASVMLRQHDEALARQRAEQGGARIRQAPEQGGARIRQADEQQQHHHHHHHHHHSW